MKNKQLLSKLREVPDDCTVVLSSSKVVGDCEIAIILYDVSGVSTSDGVLVARWNSAQRFLSVKEIISLLENIHDEQEITVSVPTITALTYFPVTDAYLDIDDPEFFVVEFEHN